MVEAIMVISRRAYEEAKKVDPDIDEKIRRGEVIIRD